MKNTTIAKCWSLAALLMFVSATFQIVGGHILPGAVFFGSAACASAAADRYRKKAAGENDGKTGGTPSGETDGACADRASDAPA